MKTAISIPDELFQAAEKFAHQKGLSRSELYATALRQYLQGHNRDQITARLGALYGTEASAVDPELIRLQSLSLPKDQW